MNSNLDARVHYVPGELESTECKYPPDPIIADLIKVCLFTCKMGPWDERRNSREVALTCSSCSLKFFQEWPIDTTILRRHYEKNHGDILSKLKREALSFCEPDYESILLTSVSKLHGYNNSIFDRYHTSTESSKKTSIAGINTAAVPSTQLAKKEHYTALLVTAIAKRNLPFDIFDYREIKDIHSYLSRFPLLSSNSDIILCYLNTLYRKEVDKVKELIAMNTSRFAITIDEWDSGDHYNFLGVTLHFYNNNFKLVSYYIGFEALKELFITGLVLYKHLINVLEEYTILNRITSITMDTTCNMGVVLQNHLNYHRIVHERNFGRNIPSMGHILNLSTSVVLIFTFFKNDPLQLLENAMFSLEAEYSRKIDILSGMASLPGTIRDIAHGVTNMPYLRSNFKKIVLERRTNASARMKLLRDKENRWLSTYYMIDRFLFFQPEVTSLLQQMGEEGKRGMLNLSTFNITEDQWKYLTLLRDFLKIFRQPTLWLQDLDYPSINIVIPSIYVILQNLANFDFQGNALIGLAAKEAEKILLKYF